MSEVFTNERVGRVRSLTGGIARGRVAEPSHFGSSSTHAVLIHLHGLAARRVDKCRRRGGRHLSFERRRRRGSTRGGRRHHRGHHGRRGGTRRAARRARRQRRGRLFDVRLRTLNGDLERRILVYARRGLDFAVQIEQEITTIWTRHDANVSRLKSFVQLKNYGKFFNSTLFSTLITMIKIATYTGIFDVHRMLQFSMLDQKGQTF